MNEEDFKGRELGGTWQKMKLENKTREAIQYFLWNGTIIGEFDLYDYGLRTKKAYLVHQIAYGWNKWDIYPQTREYLKIVWFTENNEKIVYGYVYFMLYTDKEGLKRSAYIGSKVDEQYRGKGLGDLLMSIYLFYSHENWFISFESITRQRKLDLLYLMNKYGFKVKQSNLYDNGNRISMYKNNMVIDILKDEQRGVCFRFKTRKAENLYRQKNGRIAWSENYRYLPPLDDELNTISYELYINLGWVVPNEGYVIPTEPNNALMKQNLHKSWFSK